MLTGLAGGEYILRDLECLFSVHTDTLTVHCAFPALIQLFCILKHSTCEDKLSRRVFIHSPWLNKVTKTVMVNDRCAEAGMLMWNHNLLNTAAEWKTLIKGHYAFIVSHYVILGNNVAVNLNESGSLSVMCVVWSRLKYNPSCSLVSIMPYGTYEHIHRFIMGVCFYFNS